MCLKYLQTRNKRLSLRHLHCCKAKCICKLNVSSTIEQNVSNYFNLCDGGYFAESKPSGLGLSSPGADQVKSAFFDFINKTIISLAILPASFHSALKMSPWIIVIRYLDSCGLEELTALNGRVSGFQFQWVLIETSGKLLCSQECGPALCI